MYSGYGKNDYWAGAVKACHDMGSSLPSQEQLDQLARDLYPGTEITTGTSNGQRDNDLAVSMGFISSPSLAFWMWSSEEYSKALAYGRYFLSTFTYLYDGSRYDRDGQAVCLAE